MHLSSSDQVQLVEYGSLSVPIILVEDGSGQNAPLEGSCHPDPHCQVLLIFSSLVRSLDFCSFGGSLIPEVSLQATPNKCSKF